MGDPPAVKEEVTVKHETIQLKPGQKYPTPTPVRHAPFAVRRLACVRSS